MAFKPGEPISETNRMPVVVVPADYTPGEDISEANPLPVGGGTYHPGLPISMTNPLPVEGTGGGTTPVPTLGGLELAPLTVPFGFTGVFADADASGVPGTVEFSLEDNGAGIFSIHEVTGALSIVIPPASGTVPQVTIRAENGAGDAIIKRFAITVIGTEPDEDAFAAHLLLLLNEL